MSECNHELRYCWCQMDKIAWDTEQRLEAEIVQYREAIKKALTTMNATDWELGPGGIARKAYADLEHVYWAIPAERQVAARKRTAGKIEP